MAEAKSEMKKEAGNNKEPVFTKEQILASGKYANRRDLLNTLLDEGKTYRIEMIDNIIEKFMKGKVK